VAPLLGLTVLLGVAPGVLLDLIHRTASAFGP
jgi:hypothetical protein